MISDVYSEFGSVQLTKYLQIEKFKHVIHLVSEVEGVLKEDFQSD